jgi:hypothetical protein
VTVKEFFFKKKILLVNFQISPLSIEEKCGICLHVFFFYFLNFFNFKNKPNQNLFSRSEPFGHVSQTGVAKQYCRITHVSVTALFGLAWQNKTVTPATRGVTGLFGHASKKFRFRNIFWNGLLIKLKHKKV